ncbi:hypothetical protein ACJQWK_04305 [Exserohilum turcicum]
MVMGPPWHARGGGPWSPARRWLAGSLAPSVRQQLPLPAATSCCCYHATPDVPCYHTTSPARRARLKQHHQHPAPRPPPPPPKQPSIDNDHPATGRVRASVAEPCSIPVASCCGFLGAPASHLANNGAATCLDHQPLDATHQSALVGHFLYTDQRSKHGSLQPTMFTHRSLPFCFEGRATLAMQAHLIQSPSIRSFPPRLSCVVGPRPDLPYPCAALVLLGGGGVSASLDVSHASCRVTSCLQVPRRISRFPKKDLCPCMLAPTPVFCPFLIHDFIRIVDISLPSSLCVRMICSPPLRPLLI